MGQDHHNLDAIFGKFRRTSPADRTARNELFSEFSRGLRHHIVVEESDLFPAIRDRDSTLTGLVDLLYEDHQRIEGILRRMEAKLASPAPDTVALESELLDTLGEHNIREESFAYPWLDEHLPEPERREATLSLAKGPSRTPR